MSAASEPSDDLALILEQLGVSVHHVGAREISAFCPVHEKTIGRPNVNTPAFSMNANTGAWICYSCGARGSLQNLVHELSGDNDTQVRTLKLLNTAKLERIVAHDLRTERTEPEPDEYTFSRFDPVPEVAADARRLDPGLCDRYGVRWNKAKKAWVVPIRDEYGRLRGWQEKRQGWVRNRPEGVAKSECLFGLDMLCEGEPAILVESPLDVVRMATVGVTGGVASYGAAVSDKQLALLRDYADSLIVALDNDDAGMLAVRKLRKDHKLGGFRGPVKYFNYDGPRYKDPGDMPAAAIRYGVEMASILPWWLL